MPYKKERKYQADRARCLRLMTAGLCIWCAVNPLAQGSKRYCEDCRDKRRRAERRYYHRRKRLSMTPMVRHEP